MGREERGAGNVAGLAGASGNVLKAAPAADKRREVVRSNDRPHIAVVGMGVAGVPNVDGLTVDVEGVLGTSPPG